MVHLHFKIALNGRIIIPDCGEKQEIDNFHQCRPKNMHTW